MDDITWLIFTVLSWKLLCKEWPSIQASSQHTSHSPFNVCPPIRVLKWMAAEYLARCSSGCSIICTLLFHYCIRSDLLRLGIDLRSTIVHFLSPQLERCSIQRRDPPWNIEGERSEAKLNPSTTQLECYWCMGEIAYYLQEINIGHFKCSLTKIILSFLLCAWGQQPVKDFSWHIRSSGRLSFSGLQIRVSQNNTWKRQKIQWKVSSHPEVNHWVANFKSEENSENHCVILWLKDSYGCGTCE